MAESNASDSFACWDGFDITFDKQFAPATSPQLTPPDLHRSVGAMPKPQESSEDSMGPPTPVDRDYVSLGQLWDTLREKKARQMAKEVPKVKSLEDGTREPDRDMQYVVQHIRAPSPSPMPEEAYKPGPTPQKVKKRKSIATFCESSDGRTVTATFDLPGIKKSQVHVSFRGQYLLVDWETVNITEHEEGGKTVRDRREVKCSRTLPMPEGTRFEEVRASMDGRHLILTYPNMRPMRVEPRRGDSF
jgi:HSP20 family molecular chaperone IbpA